MAERSRPGWRETFAGRRRTLLLGEYLPLAGGLLSWLIVTLAIGHRAAVVLIAANVLVGGFSNLFALNVRRPLIRSLARGEEPSRRWWRAMWRYEAGSMLLAIALTLAVAWAAAHTHHQALAVPLAILSLCIPGWHIGPLAVAASRRGMMARLGPSRVLIGLPLLAAAALGGARLPAFACALVLRMWLAIGLLLLRVSRAPVERAAAWPPERRPAWRDIAAASHESSRRRALYRMSKIALGGLFGPLGTALARTLRGTGAIARLELSPRRARVVAALVGVAGAAGAAWILSRPGELRLVLGCGLVRVATTGASTFLWSFYGRPDGTAAEEEEDDDD